MKKFIAWVLCLALILCLATGCTQSKGLKKVVVSEVTHSVFYAPQYAAIALGYFEEEGIDLELINGQGADKVMTAVISGQVDVGLAGPESCIYVYNEGKEDFAQVFAQLTKRDGSFLVGREPVSSFSYDMLKGSHLLGGRKGGMPLMTLEYVLKQHGLQPGKDINVDTSVQFAMMAGAFTGGTGDYVMLFEPTATEVVNQGKGYILTSLGLDSGEIPYTAYFANQSYIDAHPDIIQKFTNAIYRGQQWVKNASAEEIAAVIAPYFPDTDMDVLIAVTQRHKEIDAWNDTPILKEEAFTRLQDVMEEAGELSERAPYEAIVNCSFGEASIRENQ